MDTAPESFDSVMRYILLVLLLLATLAPAAFAADKVKADDVVLTHDKDHVEACKALGPVQAKSGWGGSQGIGKGIASVQATLRKRGGEMGGNTVLVEKISSGMSTSGNGVAYSCSTEGIEEKAAAPITCAAGTDCEVRWSRVTLWLQKNASWQFRNVTDTLITTEGPDDTENKPAFEATKVPAGDGKTYRIALRGFCGNDCEALVTRLRANFHDVLTAPIE